MGFFDKIKGMVGIGQPKLAFTLASSQIKRGSSITGKAVLTGGSTEQPVKAFFFEHIEVLTRREWSDSLKKTVDKKVRNTVNKIEVVKNEELIKPGETMEVDFELPVSGAAMNSGHPYAHEFKVSVDVPGLDPSKSKEIFIL
ncbi:MAG: sporulation-control protein spo0M [Chitinophagales bacterium]|jgi:sporulation-control protein spo0M